MADTPSITILSRRAILARVPAAVALGGPVPAARAAGTPGDARLAVLAVAYWRTVGRIHALIAEAERHYGPGTWLGPAYAARYDRLAAREQRLIAAIAETPPASIVGLATKMRVATSSRERDDGPGDGLLEPVFHPALRDLARLAAEAAP